MDDAQQWVARNIAVPQARADLLKHARQAEAARQDFDCRIGPAITGGQAVWAWSVAGAFFAFRLTSEQRRRLELKDGTMTFRTRRPAQPEPTATSVVLKHIAFEQEPLVVDRPIVLTLTSSTQSGDDPPWAATLELVRPGGGHEQHWAYPTPGTRLNGPARLQFARLHEGAGSDAPPFAGLLPVFITVWHVPNTTEPWGRVPISPPVGRLLDLAPPAQDAADAGR